MSYGAYIEMSHRELTTNIEEKNTQLLLPIEQQIGAVSLIGTQLELDFS